MLLFYDGSIVQWFTHLPDKQKYCWLCPNRRHKWGLELKTGVGAYQFLYQCPQVLAMHTDCKSTVLLHARLVLSEKGGHSREDEAIQSIASCRNMITTYL